MTNKNIKTMSQKPPPKQFVKVPINGTKFTLLNF